MYTILYNFLHCSTFAVLSRGHPSTGRIQKRARMNCIVLFAILLILREIFCSITLSTGPITCFTKTSAGQAFGFVHDLYAQLFVIWIVDFSLATDWWRWWWFCTPIGTRETSINLIYGCAPSPHTCYKIRCVG